jgi:hypothetical protein
VQAKKKRGGQPQNQNARKHGFYSAHFKHRETQLLETLDPADISAEIELIRVTCARFLRAWNASKATPEYEASLTALRAVNVSAQTIAMLLRAQSITAPPREDLAEFLEEMSPEDSETGADDQNRFGLVPGAPPPA